MQDSCTLHKIQYKGTGLKSGHKLNIASQKKSYSEKYYTFISTLQTRKIYFLAPIIRILKITKNADKITWWQKLELPAECLVSSSTSNPSSASSLNPYGIISRDELAVSLLIRDDWVESPVAFESHHKSSVPIELSLRDKFAVLCKWSFSIETKSVFCKKSAPFCRARKYLQKLPNLQNV